ncbi:hypothetical protein [Colwellia polaris]|mgnify:CR=1 FL=1|jgi:hypothetical protein|uniref:hypothetical protein n=1 Tax=Colwellia polaris TaxID=326537 RepID=UPI000A175856|nr:hypothetical protein [Colwellia polaris]|tara:strand:+ start:830 stop:1636 length:807 start_codon:yes stop_codon:yes gene_type:complete
MSFTELDIIEACNQLELENKTINGTNLRLQIGSGSPKVLYDTYNTLLAKGRIKLIADSRVEELELQLEAQLEALHKQEETNRVLKSALELALASAMDSADYLERFVDASWPLNPFEEMKEELNRGIKGAGLSYKDVHESGLITYKKSLVEKQIGLLASVTGNADEELCILKQRLAAAMFVNETKTSIDYSDDIIQIKNKIELRTSYLENIKKTESIERNKAIEIKILKKSEKDRTKEEKIFLLKLAACGYEMELGLELLLIESGMSNK